MNKCFRAATTKKTIFHRKMAQKCQFLAQISFSGSGWSARPPPNPILRVLDPNKDVVHAMEAI